MQKKQLDAIKSTYLKTKANIKHYDGCELINPVCAIMKLIQHIEENDDTTEISLENTDQNAIEAFFLFDRDVRAQNTYTSFLDTGPVIDISFSADDGIIFVNNILNR